MSCTHTGMQAYTWTCLSASIKKYKNVPPARQILIQHFFAFLLLLLVLTTNEQFRIRKQLLWGHFVVCMCFCIKKFQRAYTHTGIHSHLHLGIQFNELFVCQF